MYAWGYMDEECQGVSGITGVGGILFFEEDHKTCFKADLDEGMNNWAELNALWLLIRFTTDKGVVKLQIMGDSKIVIDWISGITIVLKIGTGRGSNLNRNRNR
jgi:ribonuclease HI